MFEKEAEEWTIDYVCKDCSRYEKCKSKEHCTCKECSKDKWQNGAEFGYNKAKVEVEDSYRESLCNSELNLASVTEQLEELEKSNEWHYVKDGDLPTEDLRQRTRGYYLTASKYKWHKWFIFDVAYFTGVIFIKGGAILDSVVAWREIVPPNENKKETDLNPDYFSGGW